MSVLVTSDIDDCGKLQSTKADFMWQQKTSLSVSYILSDKHKWVTNLLLSYGFTKIATVTVSLLAPTRTKIFKALRPLCMGLNTDCIISVVDALPFCIFAGTKEMALLTLVERSIICLEMPSNQGCVDTLAFTIVFW